MTTREHPMEMTRDVLRRAARSLFNGGKDTVDIARTMKLASEAEAADLLSEARAREPARTKNGGLRDVS